MNRFLYLRGLAIVGVVMYHATGWGFTAMFWWTNQYRPVAVPNFDQLGGISYYALRVIEQLVIFVVPAFLFVSGYVSTKSYEKNSAAIQWPRIFTRVRRVLIPFLIWSVLILALDILLGSRFSLLQFVITLITGRTTEAYYFIPVLIQLYLLIPLLLPLAKTHWKQLLVVSALLMIYTDVLDYVVILNPGLIASNPLLRPIPGWLFVGHMFWFCLGLVVGFYHARLYAVLVRIKWWLVIMLVVTFCLGILEWEYLLHNSGLDWIGPRMTLIDAVYILLFLMSFLAFEDAALPLPSQFSELGARSYGIYLVHSLVLIVVAKLIYHFVPVILGYQILFQPMLVISGLAVPVILMEFVYKSRLKPYYEYLFGRR